MRRLSGILFLGMLLGACGPATDSAKGPEPDAPSASSNVFDLPYLVRDLDNGLRVVIVRTDYPGIFTLQVPVQTGARNEVEPGKTGFAHFFEHMMFRGTEKFSADTYISIIKSAGADQNAYTSFDYTNYYVTATTQDLERIIEVEADRFQNLKYSEEQFRTEALAVKGEYLKNFSNPLSKMYERLFDLAFDAHTYEHLPMGFIEDIEAMPEQYEYSRLFFERWYRPEKTTVILVGDLDPDATFELVSKYWGGWERGDYELELPVEPPLDGPVYEHVQWDSPTQPWLLFGFRGPAFSPTDKALPAAHLVSAIYFSESSDLYRKLVIDERWADELVARFDNPVDPGVLDIVVRLTDESYLAEVRDAIHATLAEARTRLVDDNRLADTKSRLRYSFTAALGDSGSIGAMLARYVHYFRDPETVNQVYRTFDSLTAEELRHYADQIFSDANLVTVSLSNATSIAAMDAPSSIDEAAADMRATLPQGSSSEPPRIAELPAVETPDAEAAPVRFVTRPSATSPLVDVSFIFHTGAAFDPPGKKGLATMTARMLSQGGSQAMTIDEINSAMYPIAAGFDSQVDKEMTRLSGQVHKDNLDKWYSLVRGQLLFPAWSEDDFERLRIQVRNEIRTDLVGNNDEELGKEVLYSSVYGEDHPYGSLSLGAISDLDSITLEDVKAFYDRYYTIANLTVGLAGGFTESFATRVGSDLQRLGNGEQAVLDLPAAPMPEGRQAVIVEKETPAVAVSFGFPIELKRGDPDWVALWLAQSYLGEHRSMNGQLFKRIREARGMNYGNYAYIEYFPQGMFQVKPSANLGRQQQLFQVWLRPLRDNNDAHFATRAAMFELDRLVREGMTETDFEATRTFLGKFVSLLTDGQTRQLGYELDSQYYGIEDFPAYVRKELESLSLDDVNRVIRENLRTDNVQYVFVSRDPTDLRRRLVEDLASPLTYNADKPRALLEEDARISALPLGIGDDKVEIVDAEAVFR